MWDIPWALMWNATWRCIYPYEFKDNDGGMTKSLCKLKIICMMLRQGYLITHIFSTKEKDVYFLIVVVVIAFMRGNVIPNFDFVWKCEHSIFIAENSTNFSYKVLNML